MATTSGPAAVTKTRSAPASPSTAARNQNTNTYRALVRMLVLGRQSREANSIFDGVFQAHEQRRQEKALRSRRGEPQVYDLAQSKSIIHKLNKDDALIIIETLAGEHAPIACLSGHGRSRCTEYKALAELLTSYTGTTVLESQARGFLVSSRSLGRYCATADFWKLLGERPWPPQAPALAVSPRPSLPAESDEIGPRIASSESITHQDLAATFQLQDSIDALFLRQLASASQPADPISLAADAPQTPRSVHTSPEITSAGSSATGSTHYRPSIDDSACSGELMRAASRDGLAGRLVVISGRPPLHQTSPVPSDSPGQPAAETVQAMEPLPVLRSCDGDLDSLDFLREDVETLPDDFFSQQLVRRVVSA